MNRGTVAGIALSGVAFAVLTIMVALRWHPLVTFDDATTRAAHFFILTRPWLLPSATAVTNAGSPVAVNVVLVAVGTLLCATRRIRSAVYLVVARLVELGVETAVKHLLARPRPELPNPVSHASGFSFPSGHAAGTTVFYLALLTLATSISATHRRGFALLASLAVLLIVGVATSRVLLGVHYPSDVVGGVLLGLTCVFATRPLRPRSESDTSATPSHGLRRSHSGSASSDDEE